MAVNVLQYVVGKVPACPCKGRRWDVVSGQIISENVRGGMKWFRLSSGYSIQEDWVLSVSDEPIDVNPLDYNLS